MSSQMVLKRTTLGVPELDSFRSMSSQMVLKLFIIRPYIADCFRSMSSQMVLKHSHNKMILDRVLDLCHLKWY